MDLKEKDSLIYFPLALYDLQSTTKSFLIDFINICLNIYVGIIQSIVIHIPHCGDISQSKQLSIILKIKPNTPWLF